MAEYRAVYDNGFEIIEAKDIFAVAEWCRRAAKRTFRTPIAILEAELLESAIRAELAERNRR